eukprot:s1658_g11.t1
MGKTHEQGYFPKSLTLKKTPGFFVFVFATVLSSGRAGQGDQTISNPELRNADRSQYILISFSLCAFSPRPTLRPNVESTTALCAARVRDVAPRMCRGHNQAVSLLETESAEGSDPIAKFASIACLEGTDTTETSITAFEISARQSTTLCGHNERSASASSIPPSWSACCSVS